MQRLTAKESTLCPNCRLHTSQARTGKRGERYCGMCGETFTLKESRAAQQRADCLFCGRDYETCVKDLQQGC